MRRGEKTLLNACGFKGGGRGDGGGGGGESSGQAGLAHTHTPARR